MADPGPRLFLAPTEPPRLRALGETSLLTERNGVDVLWASRGGLWGIQRKEVSDLIASRDDGRLAQELAQMASLEVGVLVVEGKMHWTSDGELVSEWSKMSRRGFHAMLWSMRMRGIWVERTDDLSHTIDVVKWLADWSRKERHSGLRGRPGPASNWGHTSDREWGIHILSGFQGIGPTTAEAIYDHFGRIPLSWDVTADDLMEVGGIGKKRAATLVRSLQHETEAVA